MITKSMTVEASGFHDDVDVAFIRFEYTEGDLYRWVSAAAFVSQHNFLSVTDLDYRCIFLDENQEEVEFYDDCSVVNIYANHIRFSGNEKHDETGKVWLTNRIALKDLTFN
jgi:hypothetical protein